MRLGGAIGIKSAITGRGLAEVAAAAKEDEKTLCLAREEAVARQDATKTRRV